MEHFLLWELPLKRGNLYYHSALLSNGAKTVGRGGSKLSITDKFKKQLQEQIDNAKITES